jgi:hypothetical protein
VGTEPAQDYDFGIGEVVVAGGEAPMTTMTTRFEQVTARGSVRTFCRDCKKKITKQFTIMNTVNPYNTIGERVERRPKTFEEVRADVRRERDAREKYLLEKGSFCKMCNEKYPWPGPKE